MIHGAKLLNKNKTHKVTFAKKNKKNQKKKYVKFENRQRSSKCCKTGGWGNICLNIQKWLAIQIRYARLTRILYCGGAKMRLMYNAMGAKSRRHTDEHKNIMRLKAIQKQIPPSTKVLQVLNKKQSQPKHI